MESPETANVKIEIRRGALINPKWFFTDGSRVDVIEEIKKVPGLIYKHRLIASHGYAPDEEYVLVTNDVGQAIELYVRDDGQYAGMKLSEFIIKTLFTQINKQ